MTTSGRGTTILVEIEGMDYVKMELSRFAKEYPKILSEELLSEAMDIEDEIMKVTPKKTGTLQGLNYVGNPQIDGGSIMIAIGNSCDYAEPVHERVWVNHKYPTMAKFIEIPARAMSARLAQRLAERINRRVENEFGK